MTFVYVNLDYNCIYIYTIYNVHIYTIYILQYRFNIQNNQKIFIQIFLEIIYQIIIYYFIYFL